MFTSFGQVAENHNKFSRHSLFAEFGGNAPMVSINYDFRTPIKNDRISHAFTMGMTHHFENLKDFVAAPQYNLLIGKLLMAETGAGVTLPFLYLHNWVVIPRLGIRYQKPGGGMMYRLAFTPILSPGDSKVFLPMFGFSVGYSFRHCNK